MSSRRKCGNLVASMAAVLRMTLAGSAACLLAGPPGFAQTCIDLPSGLVSWWPADGNATDFSGPNPGQLQQGASFGAAEVLQGFLLDGVDDHVLIPHQASLNLPSALSVEAWINPSDLTCTDTRRIANKLTSGPFVGWNFDLQCGTGRLRVELFNSSGTGNSRTSSSSIPTGTLTHVAFTWDGTKIRIYVNGALDAQGGTTIASIGANTVPLLIGRFSASYFKGLIDELSIYSRALSDAEVQALYLAGRAGRCKSCLIPPAGLVAWWPGDGDALDRKGSHDGSLVGGAGFAAGHVGPAFSLDGIDDSVEVPHRQSLDLTAALTADAWVSPDDYVCTGEHRIVNKLTPSPPYIGWNLDLICSTHKLRAEIFSASGAVNTIFSNAKIPIGGFTHVAFSWDGATLRLYKDGALDSSAATTIPSVGTNAEPLRIGRHAGSFFKGRVDEVELFDRALTAFEVQDLYNSGSHGKCKAWTCSDMDGDGYGSPGIEACLSGRTEDCREDDGCTHPGAGELCDSRDNDCDGTLDESPLAGPTPIGNLRVQADRITLMWSACGGSTYDVTKGNLAALHNTSGDFTSSFLACLENDSLDTSSSDGFFPGPGAGWYYLARGNFGCGQATYDSDGSSQQGSRDAEINAATGHCP